MAVVNRTPLLLKIVFPPLFFLELIRRLVHFVLISHVGPVYRRENRSALEPFNASVRQAISDLGRKQPPTVMEIGPGPHPDIDAYPPGTHLICIEPCPDFNNKLNETWKNSHLSGNGKLTVINCKVEEIDPKIVEDESVDLAISQLVNCSVSDVDLAFRNIHRVLKPNGRYYFWDHVLSDDNWLIRFIQRALCFPGITYFTDCNPARQPWLHLESAGFSKVNAKRFQAPMKGITFAVVKPTACGYAVK